MALPYSFSNNATPTGVQLDDDLAALGALTTIPCTIAGTDTLVLTPGANTPTLSAYANYLRLSGVATATNTGATTARVNALAALNVYRDSPAGPVACVGGEIISGNAITLVYDSALNGGAGGFHLVSTTNSLAVAGGTISGNLSVTGIGTLGTLSVTGPTTLTGPATLSTLSVTSGVQVGGTTFATLSRLLSETSTIAFSITVANGSQDQPATLSGVQLGDSISVGVTTVPSGAGFSGYVPAAGTVNLRCLNATAATLAAFTIVARLTAQGFA